MRKYEIEYEMKNGEGDYITTYDEDEATAEMEELKENPECVSATLKEYYIYGGMCQGENIIDEFTREETEE